MVRQRHVGHGACAGGPLNTSLALAAEESLKNDGESICCQGFLLPVNAGIVFMRPTERALQAVVRFRERVLSGPCWGQAAMCLGTWHLLNALERHWALFELCSEMRCDLLDPWRFASAGPLAEALRGSQKPRPAMTLGSEALQSFVTLGSTWTSTRLGVERKLRMAEAKRKFNKLFNGVYGMPEACREAQEL